MGRMESECLFVSAAITTENFSRSITVLQLDGSGLR